MYIISKTLGLSLCMHVLDIKMLSALWVWWSGISKQSEEPITNCKLYSKEWVNSRLSLLPSALPERLCQTFGNQSFWVAKAAATRCYDLYSPDCELFPTSINHPPKSVDLLWDTRQNLPLSYKHKTQNLINYLVKYPLWTLQCSQRETSVSYRILEIVLSRLHALAGSIFGLIKSFQTCGDVHKTEALTNIEEWDAESSEKSVEANVSSHHLWKADLHGECSLNIACPYSNSKSRLPRKQDSLGGASCRARGAQSGKGEH